MMKLRGIRYEVSLFGGIVQALVYYLILVFSLVAGSLSFYIIVRAANV